MGRLLLAIEMGNAMPLKESHQVSQRNLAGVRCRGKHRFTEERAAQTDAIEPAGQLSIYPCLHAMDLPGLVPLPVCPNDTSGNPRSGLSAPRPRAGPDDMMEGQIGGDHYALVAGVFEPFHLPELLPQ